MASGGEHHPASQTRLLQTCGVTGSCKAGPDAPLTPEAASHPQGQVAAAGRQKQNPRLEAGLVWAAATGKLCGYVQFGKGCCSPQVQAGRELSWT